MKIVVLIFLTIHSFIYASIHLELEGYQYPYLGNPVTVNIVSTDYMECFSGFVVIHNALFEYCITYPAAGDYGYNEHYPMPPDDAYYLFSGGFMATLPFPGIHHSVGFIMSDYNMVVELADEYFNLLDVLVISTLLDPYVDANAGGPYLIYEGESLVLDGRGSAHGGLNNGIEGYNWEIDGITVGSGEQLEIAYTDLPESIKQGGVHILSLHVWGSYDIGEPYPGLTEDSDETTLEIVRSFNITSPQNDDAWNSGGYHTIQWNTLSIVENVKIEYSIDPNSSEWILIDQIPNSGSYNWIVPEHTSQKCLIRISNATDSNVFKTSEIFTIYECTFYSDLNNDCFVNLEDFAILASNWLATEFALKTSVIGEGGIITPSISIYIKGEVVTLIANPDSGYRVKAWTGTDDDSSTSNINTVTMNSDKNVTVEFELIFIPALSIYVDGSKAPSYVYDYDLSLPPLVKTVQIYSNHNLPWSGILKLHTKDNIITHFQDAYTYNLAGINGMNTPSDIDLLEWSFVSSGSPQPGIQHSVNFIIDYPYGNIAFECLKLELFIYNESVGNFQLIDTLTWTENLMEPYTAVRAEGPFHVSPNSTVVFKACECYEGLVFYDWWIGDYLVNLDQGNNLELSYGTLFNTYGLNVGIHEILLEATYFVDLGNGYEEASFAYDNTTLEILP